MIREMVTAREGSVYILTNKHHTVLYAGVTANLGKRVWIHKQKIIKGFTSKYNVDILVYVEKYEDIVMAIKREKQIKNLVRTKKIALIESQNPNWDDLFTE